MITRPLQTHDRGTPESDEDDIDGDNHNQDGFRKRVKTATGTEDMWSVQTQTQLASWREPIGSAWTIASYMEWLSAQGLA